MYVTHTHIACIESERELRKREGGGNMSNHLSITLTISLSGCLASATGTTAERATVTDPQWVNSDKSYNV